MSAVVPEAAPTLARQIIDLPEDATNVFIGMVASHFATTETLDRATVTRYVGESLAVTR